MLNNICSDCGDCGDNCAITVIQQETTNTIESCQTLDFSGLTSPSTTQIFYINTLSNLADSPSTIIASGTTAEASDIEYTDIAAIDGLSISASAPRYLLAFITSISAICIKQLDFTMVAASTGAGITEVLIRIWNFNTLVWDTIDTILINTGAGFQTTVSKYTPNSNNFNTGRFFIHLSTATNTIELDYASVRLQTCADGEPTQYLHFSSNPTIFGTASYDLRAGVSRLGYYITNDGQIRMAMIITAVNNSYVYEIYVNGILSGSVTFVAETQKIQNLVPINVVFGDIVTMMISGGTVETSAILVIV